MKKITKPSKRTPEMREKLCELVGKGLPFGHACRIAGISYSTFCDWRNTDEELREQLDAAISAAVEKRLQVIQDAASAGDWRAAECWLRLVLPTEYGRNRVELSGPDGTALGVGIQIYLPQKQGAASVRSEPLAPAALKQGQP